MPTIPIFTAEHGPGVFQAPHVPPPVPIESGGEALTQAGERFLEIGQRIRAQQDNLDLYRTVTETETELQQYRQDMSVDTDYETQAERFVKLANEVKYRKLGTLRSPAVAAVYQARAERMIVEAGIHVRTEANKKWIAQQGATELALGEQSAKLWITATPERQVELRDDWFAKVDRSLAFTPDQKNRKKAMWDQWTATEAILKNPSEALAMLEKGQFSELDSTQRATLIRSAEIAEERQERLTKQEVKEAQEATKQEFVEKWAKDTLTPKEILASNLDATGEGGKEHYLKLMAAKEREQPFVDDPRLKADLLHKIRTNKIVSNEQLERIYIDSASKKRGIDWQSMMDLRKELTDMQTPDGRVLGHRKQEMFNGVKASIDKSVIGMKTDPEGSLLFLRYQEWVDAQLAVYKQSGKNPHDLLDPSTPGYLARPAAIAPFQRSLQDTMKEMSERFKRPNRTPLTPEQQRKPGETVEQYLKRAK